MKCVIRNCNKEADLPFFACSKEHGFDWKNIQLAIKGGFEKYNSYPYPVELTKEDREFYKPLIK